MTTALYILWILLPLFFLLMTLWSYLEKTAGKKVTERPGDLFKQFLFVTFCVSVSILLDQYILRDLLTPLSDLGVPYEVFQIALLPFVLFVAAKLIGPTKSILITKPPEVSKSKRLRKP